MSSPAYGSRLSDAAISDALTELALDLRWSFNHAADQNLGAARSRTLGTDAQSVGRACRLCPGKSCRASPAIRISRRWWPISTDRKRRTTSPTDGFKKRIRIPALSAIAYFSMEFMLSEALPIYSGGLGNVAGDQLKTASNLGVPVTAV